jgi:hypothetical protein
MPSTEARMTCVGSNRLWVMALILFVSGVAAHAANIEKTIADAQSRRRAAENGLREIKSKVPDRSEDARRAYATAADGQNAWLEQVCQTVESGAAAADVASTAQTAASTLVAWVAVRNRALGVPVMTNEIAESVKKSMVQDLVEIANAMTKSARGSDPQKRLKMAASLRDQLQWKSSEDVQ